MEQILLICGVLVFTAVALYCVRLLDRAWTAFKNRPARRPERRPAEHHEEIKLPRR